MTTKLKFQLTIPIEIEMAHLLPGGEFQFVSACMKNPGNDLSNEENRAWFSNLWREQVLFQQALLANPEYLARFAKYLVLEELENEQIPSAALEEVIRPIAEARNKLAHFSPVLEETGVDTYTMLGEVIAAAKLSFGDASVSTIEITSEDSASPPIGTKS